MIPRRCIWSPSASSPFLALVAKNLVRGRLGRSWMVIRNRDIAAEIIGIRPRRAVS